MRGHMSTYLHLRHGGQARPLLFTVSGGDDPFRPRILQLAEQFRAGTGQTPLLVFDRGGSGWEMVESLSSQGQPFACYIPDEPEGRDGEVHAGSGLGAAFPQA